MNKKVEVQKIDDEEEPPQPQKLLPAPVIEQKEITWMQIEYLNLLFLKHDISHQKNDATISFEKSSQVLKIILEKQNKTLIIDPSLSCMKVISPQKQS